MNTMNIAFFEVMPGEREELMALLPPGHDIRFFEEKLSEKTIAGAADADIVSVFVHSEIQPPLIDRLPNLKLLTTRSMGYDHIDVAYTKSKGIRIANVTTYAAHPVAEFTFALLLGVTRRIYHAYDQLREGTNPDIRGLQGVNLFGKTLGVVGTGRIGKNVIAIACAFGMQVLAYDTKPDAAFAAEQSCAYVTLDELLAQSDIITLHAPYLKETHHLIDTPQFARMKNGAILINTARGELVNTTALIAALRDGSLWGAGLDVLEGERSLHSELLPENRILIGMPNVIITPHIAFETAEAFEEIERATAQTIGNFIAGTEQSYL